MRQRLWPVRRRVARLLHRVSARLDPPPAAPPEPPWPPAWAEPVVRRAEATGILWAMREQDLDDVAPWLTWAPPGHFYSSVPTTSEARGRTASVDWSATGVPGIDLGLERQLAWLAELARHADFDPPAEPEPGWRYHHANEQFGIGDATVLQAMLRRAGTRRVVEIGSGFSSAVVLDTADRHLPELTLTVVEPFPERLFGLLRPGDRERITVHERKVQDVDLSIVDELEAGDVLFIDSSHVVKPGSDVCTELLELVPRVAPGVLVHVHDVAHPFELPEPWVAEGRGWTETYLVRAFLQYNHEFEIVLFNSCLARLAPSALLEALPGVAPDPGLSLWLRRRDPPGGEVWTT